MRTNLMAASGDQLHFQKSQTVSRPYRCVLCLNRLGIRLLHGTDKYLVFFVILYKITGKMSFFLQFSLHQTPVILMHGPVMEHFSQSLQTGNGLSGCHNAAGIPVQTITDGRPEMIQILTCDTAAL